MAKFGDFFDFLGQGAFTGGTGQIAIVHNVEEGIKKGHHFGSGTIDIMGGFEVADDGPKSKIGASMFGGFAADIIGDRDSGISGSFSHLVTGSAKGADTMLGSAATETGSLHYGAKSGGSWDFEQINVGSAEGSSFQIGLTSQNMWELHL